YPRPPVQTLRGSSQTRRLSADLTTQLRRLSREAEVTLFMTVLASFQVLLAHISGQDDIVVGIDSANRAQVETEHLIGFFINQLALRVKLAGNPTFREVLRQVR